MKDFGTAQIRNVALVAHHGVGKTSLAEAMLFLAKATSRLGRIAEGTTVLDHAPDEIQRQITISLGLAQFEWAGHKVNLIDLKTMGYIAEIPVGGVPRPIAVTRDEKTMFVALSDLHGFAVVDVARRQVVEKVKLPPPAPGAQPLVPHTLTHGLELTPDGEELWVTSMVGDGVYVYDLGTKKLSDKIVTGKAPDWLTFTPDGKYCCVSNAGTDDCSIIDTRSRREVARLKVGKVPKRLVVASVPGT